MYLVTNDARYAVGFPSFEWAHSGLYVGQFCAKITSSMGLAPAVASFAHLIASTFSSTSGILTATTGLNVAFITLIVTGKLTMSHAIVLTPVTCINP